MHLRSVWSGCSTSSLPPRVGCPESSTAIQAARQDTFTALNLPIVPNPTPTVMPQGVVQVAVVGAINVGGAIIFTGFQRLCPVRFRPLMPSRRNWRRPAIRYGRPPRVSTTAAGVVTAAGTVVADSVVTAVNNVRTAAGQSLSGNAMTQIQKFLYRQQRRFRSRWNRLAG